MRGKRKTSTWDRFEKFVDRVGVTGTCHIWSGAKDKDGYGRFRLNGAHLPAPRVAWLYAFPGRSISGLCVCHTCDNPSCVNSDHLFLGTHKDNAVDRGRKGRASDRRGEKAAAAVLNCEKVAEIRARSSAGDTGRNLAREFGVSTSQISNIILRKEWAHV